MPAEVDRNIKNSSFSLQQLNLFFNKLVEDKFNVFINFEFQASYSSERESGAFNLQEGWVNYNHSDRLDLKVGLLLPIFNNLNEIQNRLPLFPYLFRPGIYETLATGQFIFEDYRPEQAYLQLSGFVPMGSLRLDYAAHMGNSETSFLATTKPGSGISAGGPEVAQNAFQGEDLSYFKAYGGRIGVRSPNERFKAGLSMTYDRDNRNSITEKSASRLPGFVIPALGEVPRLRLGGDLSFQRGRFAFEGEFIKVRHDVDYPLLPALSLDKDYYYVNLLYNFSDRLWGYTGFERFIDQTFEAVVPHSPDAAGIADVILGSGYKINEVIVLKSQYANIWFADNPHIRVRAQWWFAGLSLIF